MKVSSAIASIILSILLSTSVYATNLRGAQPEERDLQQTSYLSQEEIQNFLATNAYGDQHAALSCKIFI